MYRVNGGLKIGDSTIWISTRTYLLRTADYAALPILSANNGPTRPFISSYPLPQDPVVPGQGFMVKYIVKTRAYTRGDYALAVTSDSASVCKVEVIFVGENMPCTEPPGPSLTGYENTEIAYPEDADGKRSGQIVFKVGI